MKRFVIFGIGILIFGLKCYQMEKAYDKPVSVKITNLPTLSDYNQCRYEKYIGEPVYLDEVFEYEDPDFTQEEIDLMAQIVMNEAEGEPQEGKQAVAQVILNRILSSKFPDTVDEVVYQKDAFATGSTKTPTSDCYDAIKVAIEYKVFPLNMFYFRNKHYHNFGVPYCQIGNHYFSTED